ncbi:MAG: hypothetical protein EZS28_006521 [Streblomastix strix]|uniref:Uncharacterized protein n=1 Tax=Streblomastix strix TaxID=222440 RepID=A0A5J4WT12_9EUKA|nr:MAG: hypothetical protein EZS28_006521 [Streblomastix strix]
MNEEQQDYQEGEEIDDDYYLDYNGFQTDQIDEKDDQEDEEDEDDDYEDDDYEEDDDEDDEDDEDEEDEGKQDGYGYNYRGGIECGVFYDEDQDYDFG